MAKMDNSTEPILFQEEENEFEHPFYIKVTITTLSLLITLSTFVINKRLFKFFRRPNRRFLDQIVHFQMSVMIIVVVPALLYFNTLIWAKVPKHYLTELGCYIGPYIFTFMAAYAGIHSFFIAIFRYICIIHPNRLSQLNISPEVNGKNYVISAHICNIFFIHSFFKTEIWIHHSNCGATFCIGHKHISVAT